MAMLVVLRLTECVIPLFVLLYRARFFKRFRNKCILRR